MTMTASVTNTPLSKNIFVPAEDIDSKLDDRGVVDGQTSWEWTSCGLTFGDAYRSDGTFTSQTAAAIYRLYRLHHHGSVEAISLCRERALPVYQIFEEHFVSLTVSQASGYGAHDGDVEAMSLEAKEDIVIDQAEADAFMGECHGWQDVAMTYEDGTTFTNAQRFQAGYGVVVQIDQDDWARWLAAL